MKPNNLYNNKDQIPVIQEIHNLHCIITVIKLSLKMTNKQEGSKHHNK